MRRRNGRITVNLDGEPQAIYDLCDGYKSVLAFVLDIMMSIHSLWSSPLNAQGVVLLDEIETHLHPTWKIKIVSILRNIFPLLNFIVTTHDPLCLRGAKKGEVKVLSYSEDRDVKLESIDIPPGLPLEDLLLGVWFQMDTTLDNETNELIRKHSSLVLANEEVDRKEISRIEGKLKKRMTLSVGKGLFGSYLRTLDQVLSESCGYFSEEELSSKISEKLRKRLG